MIAYKFTKSAYVDQLLVGGLIRVASLSYYRDIEKRQWIADRNEGSVEVHYEPPITVTGDELNKITPDHAIPTVRVDTGGIIEMENIIHSFQTPDVFIFCASVGDLEGLTNVMCTKNQGYDSCLRIVDMSLLAHRIKNRGEIVELNDRPVGEVFGAVECDLVTYGAIVRTEKHPRPPPMAFLKGTEFSLQSEIRIALYPNAPVSEEILTIRISKPAQLFSLIFSQRDLPGGRTFP